MAKKLRKRWFNNRLILAALVVLIIVLIFFFALHRTNKVSTIPSTNPAKTSPTPSQSSPSSNSNGSGLTNSSKPAASSVSDSTKLITPYGTFLSNHHPTISTDKGNPGPVETSVCNTTPGATCSITFTKGSTTKQLSPQVVDSSGSAYWQWNINDAGLTEGSWDVTVTASLNGHTLSAKDTLDVQP